MSRAARSTLVLLGQLRQAASAGEAVVLRGNTCDVFVAENGTLQRLQELVAAEHAAQGRATIVFSPGSGARQLVPPGCSPVAVHLPRGNAPAHQAVAELVAQLDGVDQPVLLLMQHADLLLPAEQAAPSPEHARLLELLAEFPLEPSLAARGHRIVLIARTGELDARLERLPGFCVVDVPLPDRDERSACFSGLLSRPRRESTPVVLEDGLDVPGVARAFGGLTNDDQLRAVREAAAIGTPVTSEGLRQRKQRTLRRMGGESLLVYEPGPGLKAVAGLPQIRLLLREIQATGQSPRRTLLAGPPGVGKSHTVQAFADELGWPAVALNNFRSMWVGETERRLRRCLELIASLAPVVVHIDEIDQVIGQRSTGHSADGGLSERVLAELWAFLGTNTSHTGVLIVATTNRPELLDAAMFDRFSIVPVLHPSPAEAADLLALTASRNGRHLDADEARRAVDAHGGLLTGRVLVEVLDRAATLADLEGRTRAAAVRERHLRQAFYRLLAALDVVEHEYMALRAIELCRFSDYLPWEAARTLGLDVHLPPYVAPLLDTDGRLEPDRLRGRLAELAHERRLRRAGVAT